MKHYSKEEIKEKFNSLNYVWPAFQLVGVRSLADAPDSFDDDIYVISEIGKGLFFRTSCTTNPGVYWLKSFMNPKGTAVLKPDQYINTYEIGKHKGMYVALVQCRPVTVYRDNNKNNKADEIGMKEDTGYFGINIHKANSSVTSKIINQWSAGCQVVNDPIDYAFIIDSCKQAGFKQFTYTLLKEW